MTATKHIVVSVHHDKDLREAENIIARALTNAGIGFSTDVLPHAVDCVCGDCTGETAYNEAMEKGISEAENAFEPDSNVAKEDIVEAGNSTEAERGFY